jgi:hypothetical protein
MAAGEGGAPAGGRRSGDQWAPTSDSDNSWIQVGSWGGDPQYTCKFHQDLPGVGVKPAWGTDDGHAGYQGWVMCCN